MAIRSFELTPDVDSFIAREVERGAYKDANELVCAAITLLENGREYDQWKIFALDQALAEGDASGIAEGDVFEQIRAERKLRNQQQVARG